MTAKRGGELEDRVALVTGGADVLPLAADLREPAVVASRVAAPRAAAARAAASP